MEDPDAGGEPGGVQADPPAHGDADRHRRGLQLHPRLPRADPEPAHRLHPHHGRARGRHHASAQDRGARRALSGPHRLPRRHRPVAGVHGRGAAFRSVGAEFRHPGIHARTRRRPTPSSRMPTRSRTATSIPAIRRATASTSTRSSPRNIPTSRPICRSRGSRTARCGIGEPAIQLKRTGGRTTSPFPSLTRRAPSLSPASRRRGRGAAPLTFSAHEVGGEGASVSERMRWVLPQAHCGRTTKFPSARSRRPSASALQLAEGDARAAGTSCRNRAPGSGSSGATILQAGADALGDHLAASRSSASPRSSTPSMIFLPARSFSTPRSSLGCAASIEICCAMLSASSGRKE